MPLGKKILLRRKRKIETTPFYIDTLMDTKDTNTVAFLVKGVNRVGIANEITDVFAEKGINIVKITVPYPVPASHQEFVLAVIAEKCGGECAEEIASMLKQRVQGVNDVKIYRPYNRLLLIDFHPLIAIGERTIVLPETAFRGLVMLLLKAWGDISVGLSIRRLGKDIGANLYEKLSAYVSEEDLNVLSEMFIKTLQSMGIGVVEILSNDAMNGEVIFRIYENIECGNYGHTGKPMSSFVKGIIEGFYTRLWERRVRVEETKCIARGDKFCEFTVSVTL